MNRKKARRLWIELNRRIYLKQHGTLKGFGAIERHYNDDWRHKDYKSTGGYKASWNSELVKQLRESVGM